MVYLHAVTENQQCFLCQESEQNGGTFAVRSEVLCISRKTNNSMIAWWTHKILNKLILTLTRKEIIDQTLDFVDACCSATMGCNQVKCFQVDRAERNADRNIVDS